MVRGALYWVALTILLGCAIVGVASPFIRILAGP
ncbi:hypothetical protein EV665_11334 [Shinella granuli]|jgi:hypothetical protein|uniref:Uncharacterized protein n=1 Tax=Shinella granuli TaxID=323621 RepID=A0A4R2CQA4_SHIGR|nr:hypothetical protein EV665_11334 [Shinella granuli]